MPQSLHQAYAHIVFSTKDRAPLIDGEIEPKLHSYLAGIVNAEDGQAILINGMPDHVHLIIRVSKSIADQEMMKRLKGNSSKWMTEQGHSSFAWQRGYGWFSVAHRDLDTATEYVRKQKEHHKTVSFQDEYRRFLTSYGVDYDERYVWD